ncbi:hypothetical protein [Lysobacter sp. CA199]|uniref:hypothetical protein n=1 Tax=Lysobacter sp. CA199 TaxID=3455608 RepID=UPI003F8D8100
MASRHPALPIVNVLASALLAAVAMHSSTAASCDQRRHTALLHPIHRYFDRIELRLGQDYPLLLKWSPSQLVGQGRIDCGCGDSRRPTGTPDASQWLKPMRYLLRAWS